MVWVGLRSPGRDGLWFEHLGQRGSAGDRRGDGQLGLRQLVGPVRRLGDEQWLVGLVGFVGILGFGELFGLLRRLDFLGIFGIGYELVQLLGHLFEQQLLIEHHLVFGYQLLELGWG
jgi:hypothetical protein